METKMETEIDLGLSGNIEPVHETTDRSLLLGSDSTFTSKISWFSSFFTGGNKNAAQATEWISDRGKGMKSWREFFKTDKFKPPPSVTVAGKRLITNFEQFQSNYVCVFILIVFYCILTSPLLLLALISCVGIFYFIRAKIGSKTLKIGHLEFGTGCQYTAAILLCFPLFYLAGAGSAIFWVLGASVFFVGLHALFYASEPIPGADFIMEQV